MFVPVYITIQEGLLSITSEWLFLPRHKPAHNEYPPSRGQQRTHSVFSSAAVG